MNCQIQNISAIADFCNGLELDGKAQDYIKTLQRRNGYYATVHAKEAKMLPELRKKLLEHNFTIIE